MTELLGKFAKPVLLLHADYHLWRLDEVVWAPNVTRLMIDKFGPPPVQITVLPEGNPVWQFDRRLDNPAWIIPGLTKRLK